MIPNMAKRRPLKESEDGCIHMTVQNIKICNHNQDRYTTPELNEAFELHSYSFVDIANLENYCNCNTLYLNNNLIRKIEGLSHLSKLTFLYLSGNKIQKIEGLEGLTQLNVLDLSSNLIEKIENISHLTSLQNLNVASNLLKTAESLSELPKNQSITCLNLNNNPL